MTKPSYEITPDSEKVVGKNTHMKVMWIRTDGTRSEEEHWEAYGINLISIYEQLDLATQTFEDIKTKAEEELASVPALKTGVVLEQGVQTKIEKDKADAAEEI